MIGQFDIEKLLLDLDASVNLLLYLIYKQLGLGKLKLIAIRLQLADRFELHPKGVIECVLVQIDIFSCGFYCY